MARRAIVALWVVCALAIAWVWLRPMHDGTLPPPVTRAPRKARAKVDPHAALAQPEDEPVADEPAAQPVRTGPPEQLNRHDLENAIDHYRSKVLACKDAEQYNGFVMVKMTIERNGSLHSISVQPPVDKTRTADCVKHALHGLSFPHFRGTYVPQIEWTYPFMLGEVAGTAAAGAGGVRAP